MLTAILFNNVNNHDFLNTITEFSTMLASVISKNVSNYIFENVINYMFGNASTYNFQKSSDYRFPQNVGNSGLKNVSKC